MSLAPAIYDLILPDTRITQVRHDRIAGQNLWEIDFTWILAWSNERLEQAMIQVLRGHGLAIPDDARLIAANWLFRTRRDRRCPDLAVATWDTATGRWHPLAVIEIKCFAWVNGGWGYCPLQPNAYSSQVMCYQHECWVPTGLEMEYRGIPRVWLTHHSNAQDPLHGRGLTARGVKRIPELKGAFELQQKALSDWIFLDWQDIEQTCSGPLERFGELIRNKGLTV